MTKQQIDFIVQSATAIALNDFQTMFDERYTHNLEKFGGTSAHGRAVKECLHVLVEGAIRGTLTAISAIEEEQDNQ